MAYIFHVHGSDLTHLTFVRAYPGQISLLIEARLNQITHDGRTRSRESACPKFNYDCPTFFSAIVDRILWTTEIRSMSNTKLDQKTSIHRLASPMKHDLSYHPKIMARGMREMNKKVTEKRMALKSIQY